MRKQFCDECGPPRQAKYSVFRVSKAGRRAERMLCETCALNAERILYGDSGLPLTEMLDVLATGKPVARDEPDRTKVCPECGNTVDEVVEAGEVGCSTCYLVFREQVEQVIRKLHGRVSQ